jgi:uroporphyrinogen III methyltransferase/synthase
MMGVSNMREIFTALINAGMDQNMPAAVVENGTAASQRKFVGSIETLHYTAKENNVVSPAVIIVGKVCSLSDKLDWFSKKPLFGKKIVVTRARTNASVLSEKLKDLGCHVIEAPCIRIEPLDNAELEKAIKNIESYNWIVFTSAAGADLFFDYLIEIKFDIRKLYHIKFAAVGSETQKTIEKRGVCVDYVPKQYNGRELAEGLLFQIQKNDKILLAGAKTNSGEIAKIFSDNNIDFENIALYETVYETAQNESIAETDWVAFTSSSSVEGFAKAFPDINLTQINGLCIGEQTAETAKKYGIKTIISKKATIDGMVEKLKEVLL